ncbi:MAG: alpha/beta hydrolase, partial [Terriglobales bacterium]
YHRKLFAMDPTRGDEAQLAAFNDVENREVLFRAVDGKRLRGWLFKHPTSKRVWLYSIGRSSDIPKNLEYVRMLLESGASVFVYEYRGFGQSEGQPSVRRICQDGLSAYDCLTRQLGYTADQIVFYGESLGGSVATYVCARRRAAGIVLQSTFASLERIAKEMVPALKVYPRAMFPRPLLDTAQTLQGQHPPLLIMHGVLDNVIPLHHSLLIFGAASEPKQVVHLKHSLHTKINITDREEFVHALSSHLASLG